MSPELFMRIALTPALDLLPESLRSREAKAFILAIALQESRLVFRRQVGGPAHGYHQFELEGVEGVWNHETTKKAAREICRRLDIAQTPLGVWAAMEFHDILDCVFARLLLMTIPRELPSQNEVEEGWSQYVVAWRPGAVAKGGESAAKTQMRWPGNFLAAWQAVRP